MSDEKPRERKPKEPSFATGQEAVIYEIERACEELNKRKDLQLDEPFLRAVAMEIRAHMVLYSDLSATFRLDCKKA